MGKQSYILDPLWITKGAGDIDAEYMKYVLLAANKKFRENLKAGDVSGFNEVIFHALNLNNLAVEGMVHDFNLRPVWDDPRLAEIRESLRKIYQIPEEVSEVFKSANYLFVRLMIDYLDRMIEGLSKCKTYFSNDYVYTEKTIFILINYKKSDDYEIWKLRFDNRLKMGSRLEKIKTIQLDKSESGALKEFVKNDQNQKMKGLDPDRNVIFASMSRKEDTHIIANSIACTISFTKGISMGMPFSIPIMEELYDILVDEQVLPFTIRTWI